MEASSSSSIEDGQVVAVAKPPLTESMTSITAESSSVAAECVMTDAQDVAAAADAAAPLSTDLDSEHDTCTSVNGDAQLSASKITIDDALVSSVTAVDRNQENNQVAAPSEMSSTDTHEQNDNSPINESSLFNSLSNEEGNQNGLSFSPPPSLESTLHDPSRSSPPSLQSTLHPYRSTTSSVHKEISHHSTDEIGATYVDEVAPNLNLRFFRLARRREAVHSSDTRRRRLEELTSATGGGGEAQSAPAALFASMRYLQSHLISLRSSAGAEDNFRESTVDNDNIGENTINGPKELVSATMIEEEEELEVAIAEEMGFFEEKRHLRLVLAGTCFLILLLASLITYFTVAKKPVATSMPSMSPTLSPTFDSRPTLEIVVERQRLNCGLYSSHKFMGLCKAISAVVLNDPTAYELVNVTTANRYQMLRDRQVDVLVGGETHTIERELFEKSSQSGFTYSTPYFLDGMSYAGNKTFVECAQQHRRFGHCSTLKICVEVNTRSSHYISTRYSPEFYQIGLNLEMLENNTCNVLAGERMQLLRIFNAGNDTQDAQVAEKYIIGNETFTNEPLAIASRNHDRVWSDIVNWVVYALIYGLRHGMTRDEALCDSTGTERYNVFELNFLNAVHCVGNYHEVIYDDQFGDALRTHRNSINDGTAMLYAIPFGDAQFISLGETIGRIKQQGVLSCGSIRHDGYSANISEAHDLYGMGITYCETLSSAIFHGDSEAVSYTTFDDAEDGVGALNNGTIDVLVGVEANFDLDFGTATNPGVTFSMPYYYGNETGDNDVRFISIATNENDNTFSSLVNCIVLAGIYAVDSDNDIDKKNFLKMPLFGNNWFLRDSIKTSGNYDEIYQANFIDMLDQLMSVRGRNALNKRGGPQLLDMPGLQP